MNPLEISEALDRLAIVRNRFRALLASCRGDYGHLKESISSLRFAWLKLGQSLFDLGDETIEELLEFCLERAGEAGRQ